MKIAIISSGFLPVVDGVSVAVFNRLQQLSKRGHSVLLLCPDYSALQQIYPNWETYIGPILPNVNVIPIESNPALGLEFERDVKPRAYQRVLKELQSFQPHLIHVDEPERLTFCFLKRPGVAYARKHNIPCIGFFHTHYIDYLEDYVDWPQVVLAMVKSLLKWLFAWIYNAYSTTLVASPSTEAKVLGIGISNITQAKFLGFDADSFYSVQRISTFFEQTYGIKNIDNTVKLIFIGRLTPDKGWGFTCESCKKLIEEVNPTAISLIVVGEGPLREALTQTLGSLFPHVHFLGRVSPQLIPALLANSDIHVTTSEKETTGLTILEASASAIPVLAPRAGGVVDHIEDGKNGLFFNPQDQEDFVAKLKFLIENPAIRQEMGLFGRGYAAQYNWDNAVENLLQIWQKQISQGPD